MTAANGAPRSIAMPWQVAALIDTQLLVSLCLCEDHGGGSGTSSSGAVGVAGSGDPVC